MPNWVYNSIQVNGLKDDIEAFVNHLNTRPEFLDDENWEHQKNLSFHSFISLDPEYREEYYGTHGWKDGEQVGQTENNWYNWNNANWNTKWDAGQADVNYDGVSVSITFETAWSPPYPVYLAMAEKFPALSFEVRWDEEQGFGEELLFANNTVTQIRAWDIPNSHQEHELQDKECICAWDSDEESWYEDCPRETMKTYEVHAITKYFIKAPNSDVALKAAQAEEGGHDRPDRVEIVNTQYSEEYRVVDSTVAEPIET